MFRWKSKQKVVYIQEGVSVGYFTVDVSWRSRKGFYCLLEITGRRQLLDTMTLCSPGDFTTEFFIGDFSLRISSRCGATTEAENNGGIRGRKIEVQKWV